MDVGGGDVVDGRELLHVLRAAVAVRYKRGCRSLQVLHFFGAPVVRAEEFIRDIVLQRHLIGGRSPWAKELRDIGCIDSEQSLFAADPDFMGSPFITVAVVLTLPRFRGVSEASGRILHEQTGGKHNGGGSTRVP